MRTAQRIRARVRARGFRASGVRARGSGALLALLLLCSPALAADPDDRERPRRAAEIIASMDDRSVAPSWTTHFRLKAKKGIQFKRKLLVGDQPVILSVHGPLLSRKRLGLGFEFKF